MKLLIDAIKFNHDPWSTTYDAINIRKNETEPILVPEWLRSVRNEPAAYAISETLGNRITIQAKFKCDPGVGALEIRAIDPTCASISSELGELVHGVISLLLPESQVHKTNVLGTVKKKRVRFQENGESRFETFELQDVGIWNAGVSVSTTTWLWQYRLKPNSDWSSFDTTNHRIYTVLRLPRGPWSQFPPKANNTQLPWAEVLDYACMWAKTTRTIDQAAVRITEEVRGLEKTLCVVYDTSPYYSHPHFDCNAFLKLLRGGVGRGLKLNCQDFATVVSTFSNILGCELWQSSMSSNRDFTTNPIRLFGRTCWEKITFTSHTVAWEGACSETEDVYDASLEVDGDEDPTTTPHQSLLAANMRFGATSEKQYVFRLSPPPTPSNFRPTPNRKRDRRPIHPNPMQPSPRINGRLLRFLKTHYRYKEWQAADSKREPVSVADVCDLLRGFEHWNIVDRPQIICTSNRPPVIVTLLQNKSQPEVLVRVDVDVCSSESEARHFVLQRIGQFQLPTLHRQIDSQIGDITFIDAESGAVLFTRAKLVFLIRNAGRLCLSLVDAAFDLDNLIKRNPQAESFDCFMPQAVK